MPEIPVSPNTTLSHDFVSQMQQLLEHLHDFPFLLSHPFTSRLPVSDRAGDNASQQLRRILLEAIESLSPGPGVSFRAPHARVYNVLHLHYVEGMTINEAASELNVSVRQAYRDLRRGEESVAAMLSTRLADRTDGALNSALNSALTGDTHAQALEDEIKRMAPHAELVNVQLLIQRALKAVDRLAQGRSVVFDVAMPIDVIGVVADGAVAQQLLVSVFSHAIQEAQPGPLTLTLSKAGGCVTLALRYQVIGESSLKQDSAIAHLAERLGWQEPKKEDRDAERTVLLQMPIGGITILVVDDNANLIELFERYLAGQPCHVVQAVSGADGIRLARELQPDVVVLDVMMPEVDGWQVLQTLQTDPRTAIIPVIICSVISDPQLAGSLGASATLSKPVSRDDILGALRNLNLL